MQPSDLTPDQNIILSGIAMNPILKRNPNQDLDSIRFVEADDPDVLLPEYYISFSVDKVWPKDYDPNNPPAWASLKPSGIVEVWIIFYTPKLNSIIDVQGSSLENNIVRVSGEVDCKIANYYLLRYIDFTPDVGIGPHDMDLFLVQSDVIDRIVARFIMNYPEEAAKLERSNGFNDFFKSNIWLNRDQEAIRESVYKWPNSE